jgi:SAM-dependent methyltransferase
MSAPDFSPIAESLRQEVLSFYRERGERLEGPAGLNTLETNSGFVERRAIPLLEMLNRHAGIESVEGLRVLELGCGFGSLAIYFAARGAAVTAVDPNEERFDVGRAVAEEHGLVVEFRRGRMEALDIPARSQDVVILNNSLCYVVSRSLRATALSEVRRVLKPGGWMIVRNPNRWHPIDQFTGIPLIQLLPPHVAQRAARLLGRPRSTVRLTSTFEAARELRAAGLAGVKQVSPPSRHRSALVSTFARYQHLVATRA